jgi:integrase
VACAYTDPAAGQQTFGAFAAEWAAAQDWKQSSTDSWQSVARRLGPLWNRPLASIDRLALQHLQAELAGRYRRSTVETTMAYPGMILRAAHASGRIARDPTRGLRQPKRRVGDPDGTVGPDDVPTTAEVFAILRACPPRYRAAVALGMCGLRIGEVLGMTADRLDVDRCLVTVDRQVQSLAGVWQLTGPKRKKVRTIEVPAIVVTELRRHLRDHQGAGLLFRTPRSGQTMRRDQFYVSAWRPALVGAGLEPRRYVFHSLRHWCASSGLTKRSSIEVAGYLGDTVETIHRTYAHWLRDDRAGMARALDEVLAEGALDEEVVGR